MRTPRSGSCTSAGTAAGRCSGASAMLASRVWRRLAMAPLEREIVPEVIRGYHPMYADVDDELLLYIDDRLAHGIWRNWASFSSAAT